MTKQDQGVHHQQPAQPHVTVNVGGPATQRDALCCAIGAGWVLFIVGFFFPITWYVGLFMLFCLSDKRERPGCIACATAAVLITILVVVVAVTTPK